MELLRIILIFVAVVAAIVLQVAFANNMQQIADMKKAPFRVWAWCFWLPPLGIAMVIALPDRGETKPGAKTKSDTAVVWFCPVCHKSNNGTTNKCDCGFEKSV